MTEVKNKKDGEKHKPYLVFINKSKSVGLMTYVAQVACFSEYAERKGYIFIVDMKTNPCVNLDEEKVGIDNAWEYYYEQPFTSALSLEAIYQGYTYYVTPEYRKALLFFYKETRDSIYYKYFYKKKSDFKVISISSCLHNQKEYKQWCDIAKKYHTAFQKTLSYNISL